MKSTRAASRYAKALLDLAAERNELEAVNKDATHALGTLKSSRELRMFLGSPVVKHKVKQDVLKEVYGKNISDLTMQFVLLITRHGREGILPEIFSSFIQQYKASKNIVEATVTTSTAMEKSSLTALQNKLEKALNKNIDLTTEVNPDLIGGYVVEMDNYRLDASLAGSLVKIKRELTK